MAATRGPRRDRKAQPAIRVGTRQRTRERILDGAVLAVARHGLTKLGMGDVSESAGVSRATLYRYFPTREDLIEGLAAREAARFFEQVLAAFDEAPPGEARLGVVVEYATKHVTEHPALQRLIETEPAFVLESLRDQFTSIRKRLHTVLGPMFERTDAVRGGTIDEARLVDWMTRFLVSLYLFPDPHPQQMARAMTDMYRLLVATPATGAHKRQQRRRDR